MKIFSFGGGVQSTAALVLAAQGELDVDAFLFANVGDDSEHPATLAYVHDVAMPYAEAHGLTIHELKRTGRDGSQETLYQHLMNPARQIIIPVRLSGSGMPARRSCTDQFKISVLHKWLRAHGATAKKPATTMLGISMDEWHRMRTDSGVAYAKLAYPLIDRRLSRQDCRNIIEAAGLPLTPKSACWFCPYHRLAQWRQMHDTEPVLFEQAANLETRLNEKAKRYKDTVWLTRRLAPLRDAIGEGVQPSLFGGEFEDDACESGYCVA